MSKSADPRLSMAALHAESYHLPLDQRVLYIQNSVFNDPNFHGFDKSALTPANHQLLEARENFTKWSLEVHAGLSNKTGNLHGGAAATVLDYLTSTPLWTIAKPGFLDHGHVSRTITMTYLRPVPVGSKVTVECEVQAAGKNTANIVGKLYLNGKVCVTCVHDKAVFPATKKVAKL